MVATFLAKLREVVVVLPSKLVLVEGREVVSDMAEVVGEVLPPPPPPCSGDSLVQAALKVLNAGQPWLKADYGDLAASLWWKGVITLPCHDCDRLLLVPHRPARDPTVKLVSPQRMPKLGKGGSLQSRQALLHSLVHTENWAIDLSWDIIARFGKEGKLPKDFFDDFVKVAEDEGRHFRLLAARLEEMGLCYGALPAHDGLWESAEATCSDFAARLAIEHCVHEARGLDVLPTTISRFRKGGDSITADLLENVVYPEEITHCAAGVKWFTYACNQKLKQDSCCSTAEDGAEEQVEELMKLSPDVVKTFHETVRRYFRGPLKPPFNEEARKAAGFGPDWYLPLSVC